MRGRLAAFIVVLGTWAGPPDRLLAQGPTMAGVLKDAAAYLAGFQKQLAGIAAEETYLQEVIPKRPGPPLWRVERRILRSDLLLVRPTGADRYVELRDVFEVDGAPVRERDDRLSGLLAKPWSTAGSQVGAIINESARYNIGAIRRNVNTPLLALFFLDAASQSRFAFSRASKQREQLDPAGAAPAPGDRSEPGVFRVSTEMWAVEYRERHKPTIVRTPRGRALPARGRFWINPATGAVLMSELVLEGEGIDATITVSYQSEPLVGFLVPVAMHETYEAQGERVTGTATYGKFRRLPP